MLQQLYPAVKTAVRIWERMQQDIKNSFEIAKSRYDIAKHYWEKTKLYAQEVNKIDVHIGWEQIEDLAYEIDNEEFDYDYDTIIEMRLDSIENKLAKLETFLIHDDK